MTEANLVRWLLRRNFPGVRVLRSQVPLTKVSGTWAPQSASLNLEVEAAAERSSFPDGPLPGEVWAYSPNGEPIGTVLLGVQNGALSGIEYGWVSEEHPSDLPAVSSLLDHESGERGA